MIRWVPNFSDVQNFGLRLTPFQAISTSAILTPPIPASKVPKIDEWLQSVLWESVLPESPYSSSGSHPTDFEIHRLKGIVYLEDGTTKIIQAVRDVFEIRESEHWQKGEKEAQCKIVLIGRGLGPSVDPWKQSFESYVRR